jgi:hypothetical protein
MKPLDCCLNLLCAPSLEDAIVGHLLEHEERVSGFTLVRSEGVGKFLRGETPQELVRGRAQRVLVEIVMNGEDARALLAELQRAFPGAEVGWWITPVTQFGRFA